MTARLHVIGVDEAGRGCWAGPLVAAAVLLKRPISGLADSKKLTKLQRAALAQQIKASAIVGVGWVSAPEIDKLGLTAATAQAMGQAVSFVKTADEKIIIDGAINYLPGLRNVETVIKADSHIPAVSAASIIAKTERDAYMTRVAAQYPLYQFERHVGYGTALHRELLALHGICDLHRLSYKPIQALL